MTNDVVAHLLHQNNPKFKKHDWATIKLANKDPENNSNKKGSENETEQRTSKDPLKEFDKPLRFQCINLQTIYLKSFVSAVFKSLQVILKGEKLVCVKLSFFLNYVQYRVYCVPISFFFLLAAPSTTFLRRTKCCG